MSQCLKNLKPIQRFNFGAVCVFAFLSTLLFSLSFASSANAISISNYGNDALSDVRSNFGTTGGVTGQTGTSAQQNLVFTMPYSYTVNNLRLQMTEESFRANSIIHFNIAYTARQANGSIQNNYVSLKYFGLHLAGGVTILHDSCFEAPYEVAMTGHTFECSYTAFVPFTSNYIASSLNTRIVGPNDTNITQSDYQTQLIITPISWITVNPNALTSEDRAWLEDVIGDSSDSSAVIAKLQELKTEQQATTNAVRAQTQQQHEDYENEVEREEAKEEELNEQKDDLNLSAQATANPFANLFNFSGCVNMPTVGGWFNNPNLRVCSPYPSTISGILNFVGSAVICGFLIRIYYKHMQGGFNG